MVKDLWHLDYEKALCLLPAILESAAVSFNIHLRLNWKVMTTISVMLKIKLHLLHIIWHPKHMLIDEASAPDHISIFWKNKFHYRCHRRCRQLTALVWLPRHDTAEYLGFTTYIVVVEKWECTSDTMCLAKLFLVCHTSYLGTEATEQGFTISYI